MKFDVLLPVCTVVRKDLSHAADNEMGDSGCTAIAGALPHLSALQNVDVSGN